MDNLKALRKQLGYSQKDMANKLHMATSTYQSYELGVCDPNVDTLKSMSKIFRVSIDEIVGNDFANEYSPQTQELRRLVTMLSDSYTVQTLFYVKSLLQYQNNQI
jgi:transcriptional regulator with XRE-family HTH domain